MRPLRVHETQDNGFSRNGILVSQAMRRPDHKSHSIKKADNSKIKISKQADFLRPTLLAEQLDTLLFFASYIITTSDSEGSSSRAKLNSFIKRGKETSPIKILIRASCIFCCFSWIPPFYSQSSEGFLSPILQRRKLISERLNNLPGVTQLWMISHRWL